MELNEKDKFSSEKGHGEGLNIHPVNLASDWQFGASQQNPFHSESSIGASTSCVSASMGDSFSPNVWDHPHSQNLASMGESDLQTSSSSSYLIPGRMLPPCSSSRPGFNIPLENGWNSSNSLSNGAVFLQTGVGILHQSLSQYSSNSGFVERAAHLSCFGSGSFSDIVNSFQNMEPLIPFSAKGNTHGVDIPLSSNMKLSSEIQSEKGELPSGAPTYVSLYIDHGATIGSLEKDDEDVETLVMTSNEEKLWNETKPDENGATELSGNGQSDPSMNSIGELEREVSTKKRKKSSQDTNHSQVSKDLKLSAGATKEISNNKQKDELTPSSAPKSYGKSAEENSKNLDAPKEDYIHFRARRGQATNSHSLAERVRREKISDRMKLLQDLVPGCSKVTGKAIMLDEIINYVQSLQRQVEFLSMKLATVNPRPVFNLENHLSRDIPQSEGSSPAIGFSPNMTPSMVHPQLHLSQHNLVATRIPRIRNPSSALRRSTNSPIVTVNEFKEGSPQVSNVREPELPNVVQMISTATCPLFKSQVDHFPRDT